MLRTRFTDLLGCTVPMQLAGMGQLSTPRLAAAVADAGGLGMVGVPMRSTTGEIDAMPHWAGESVGAVKRIQPAAEIVRDLTEEAEQLLRTRGT